MCVAVSLATKSSTASYRKSSWTRKNCIRPVRKSAFGRIRRRRTDMAEQPQSSQSQAAATETAPESRSILDRIVEDGRIGQSPEERTSGKQWVKDLVREVLTGQMTVSNDTEAMINTRIGQIDALISDQ